jgi:hypothetical protein
MRTFFRLWFELLMQMIAPGVVQHVWVRTVSVPGLPTLPADTPLTVTGDYSIEVEKAIPAGTVSMEIDVGTIDFTKIQSMVMNADKAAMDIYTNAATGTGGQHFSLTANVSLAWNISIPAQVNPVSVAISKFFVNNATATAGTFRAAFVLSV